MNRNTLVTDVIELQKRNREAMTGMINDLAELCKNALTDGEQYVKTDDVLDICIKWNAFIREALNKANNG